MLNNFSLLKSVSLLGLAIFAASSSPVMAGRGKAVEGGEPLVRKPKRTVAPSQEVDTSWKTISGEKVAEIADSLRKPLGERAVVLSNRFTVKAKIASGHTPPAVNGLRPDYVAAYLKALKKGALPAKRYGDVKGAFDSASADYGTNVIAKWHSEELDHHDGGTVAAARERGKVATGSLQIFRFYAITGKGKKQTEVPLMYVAEDYLGKLVATPLQLKLSLTRADDLVAMTVDDALRHQSTGDTSLVAKGLGPKDPLHSGHLAKIFKGEKDLGDVEVTVGEVPGYDSAPVFEGSVQATMKVTENMTPHAVRAARPSYIDAFLQFRKHEIGLEELAAAFEEKGNEGTVDSRVQSTFVQLHQAKYEGPTQANASETGAADGMLVEHQLKTQTEDGEVVPVMYPIELMEGIGLQLIPAKLILSHTTSTRVRGSREKDMIRKKK